MSTFQSYDYGDLLAAPVGLQYFADACGVSVSSVKNWGRVGRSIPKKFDSVIFDSFNKLFSNNNHLQIDTVQNDIFTNKNNSLGDDESLDSILAFSGFTNEINGLYSSSPPLGSIGKSQSADLLEIALSSLPLPAKKKKTKLENPPALRSAFALLKPFEPMRFFSPVDKSDKKTRVLGAFNPENPFFKDKKLQISTANSCEYVDLEGNIFKFQRRQFQDSKTGKWLPTNEWLHVPSKDFLLTERYALHETARRLLPDMSVFNCQHAPTSGYSVGVLSSPDNEAARFFGLQNCKSPWSCPVCSAKISNKRALEIQAAYDKHKAWGGQFSFVTRTVPHTDSDSLAYTLERFKDADAKLKQKRAYKALKLKFGVLGSIKVYECTVTSNGWHLHVHEIYFHESAEVVLKAGGVNWLCFFEESLYPLWTKAAMSAGFDCPNRAHGLKVQNGDFAAVYIAKYGHEPSDNFWNIDREMTKQHLKRSRKGLSPFDLLRQYRATGQAFYGELFKEFAKTMKGARQLMWSRGLKDYFEIEEKTDEELIEEQEENSFVLGYFGKHWLEIRKRNLKAKVLILAKLGDFLAVKNYLLSLGLDFYTPEEYRSLKTSPPS